MPYIRVRSVTPGAVQRGGSGCVWAAIEALTLFGNFPDLWRAHTDQTGQSAIQAVRVNLLRLESQLTSTYFTYRHR